MSIHPESIPAPIIVTVLFGDADFAWLDGLRRRYYPPERNRVPAHLTLFRHLPPSLGPEITERLRWEARDEPPPSARMMRVVRLDRGVAIRVDSPELAAIRDRLADAFHACLTPQDAAHWQPHVTIQNKAAPAEAKRAFAELSADFPPRPLIIAGLAMWRYRDGPWEPVGRWRFNRSGRCRRS